MTQPVVGADQRLKWKKYNIENPDWMDERERIQEIDGFYHDDVVTYG
jgi:hypothetical protein